MGAKPTCLVFARREGVAGGGPYTVHLWPSNFFIEPDGTNVEAEFQCEKLWLRNPYLALPVRRMTPGRAKKYGRKFKLTKHQLAVWDDIKEDVMLNLLIRKVLDWPDIIEALNATDGPIVEVNWWHDNEWGDCQCINCYRIGENKLGKLWEFLRDEFEPVKNNPWGKCAA